MQMAGTQAKDAVGGARRLARLRRRYYVPYYYGREGYEGYEGYGREGYEGYEGYGYPYRYGRRYGRFRG